MSHHTHKLAGSTLKRRGITPLILLAFFGGWTNSADGAERIDHYFDSNGVKIRYITEGTGESIILIHGFASNAEMWNPLWPDLAKNYRLVAFDCRGHGKSDKPLDPKQHGQEAVADIPRLLDHLKIDKAHVVGYSMGAEIAGNLLVLHPERLKSVTLGGGGPAFERTDESLARQRLAATSLEDGKGIGPVIIAAAPPNGPKPSPAVADMISAMILGNQDQKALAASVRGGMTLEVSEVQLRANRVPVLIVYGSNDAAMAAQSRLDRVAELVAARIQIIEGADHLSTLVSPKFLEAVQSFIKDQEK
jgi:pimeloyl-ACP methyl ester carboxylesterase